MKRGWLLAPLAALALAPAAPAQAPQFRWKAGQVFTYRVTQSTTAVETLKDSAPLTTTSQLDLVKRWQVTGVDAAGVATLQMTLVSLRMETKPPQGDMASWHEKTMKLASAADGLGKGEAGAPERYKEAVNCKACHEAHKPKEAGEVVFAPARAMEGMCRNGVWGNDVAGD